MDRARLGERVLARAPQTTGARRAAQREGRAPEAMAVRTFGSECDGAFAEFAVAHTEEVLPTPEGWSDVEAASLPCAHATAEKMLQSARLGAEPGERVLVTGASGGVGAAAVQLLARRRAEVVAQCGADKADAVRALGAAETLGRENPFGGGLDAVVDLVAGPRWPELLEALRPGGSYVTAGAIAGPIVELDVRTLCLCDLTLFGASHEPPSVLADVIGHAERGEIAPAVAATRPFEDLPQAQAAFEAKRHVGKIVLRLEGTDG